MTEPDPATNQRFRRAGARAVRASIDRDDAVARDAAVRLAGAWIHLPESGSAPFVAGYRLRFTLTSAVLSRLHLSADERYELFLDGIRIGRGPERGDPLNWFFESFEVKLDVGEHVLAARVWSLGALAPLAQTSVEPGFALVADASLAASVDTGTAPWDAKILPGYAFRSGIDERSFTGPWETGPTPWFTGPNEVIDGARFDWGFESGQGEGWTRARGRPHGTAANGFAPLRRLKPATLPAMLNRSVDGAKVRWVATPEVADTRRAPITLSEQRLDEADGWQRLLADGRPVVIPADARRRVLIDLEQYICGYPELTVSGGDGAEVHLRWAEALYEGIGSPVKGNRDQIDGKYFRGPVGDTFLPDGGTERTFRTLWWRSGRYLEIVIETRDVALTIARLTVHETRYPLAAEGTFASHHRELALALSIARRTLEACAHETYLDCPYYEQLMYVGDARLQALAGYVSSLDDRLQRKALGLFDASRYPCGLTQSRYPGRLPQFIPPFSLWWIAMIHDHALWRGDGGLVRDLLPGVRSVLDGFVAGLAAAGLAADGLVRPRGGWNFVDWVPSWDGGVPPGAAAGVSSILNLQVALALRQAAELEAWVGEPELEGRYRRTLAGLLPRIDDAFWDEDRGLFADDAAHTSFSEHAQCLAVLGGVVDGRRRVSVERALRRGSPELTPATIYFSHYVFEAFHALGRGAALFERLGPWLELAGQGFKTTPEAPEPSRSDCHAWGAHPVYHCAATVLGVRPRGFGFQEVDIVPQLGPLRWAKGTVPHANGPIEVNVAVEGATLAGTVRLPAGLHGTFRHAGTTVRLAPGEQAIRT